MHLKIFQVALILFDTIHEFLLEEPVLYFKSRSLQDIY